MEYDGLNVSGQWLGKLVFMPAKELLKHIDAGDFPSVYGGEFQPDWEDWTQASKKALLNNREIELHTFCCSYKGEMLQLMQQLQVANQEIAAQKDSKANERI